MAEIHKIFGPPGAGKTTYLLNIVDQELSDGVRPQQIGYFSFTRKAAHEARDRATGKFPSLNPKTDFPFFRTLHSLAFFCLGTRTEDIMQAENFREFQREAGIELSLTEEEDDNFVKADNPILNEINLARIRGVDLREHYNQSGLDIEWHHFEFVERTYRHYKQRNYLLDFTDLLELIVQEDHRLPSLEVVIIDEAQDLSRLQWNLVEALAKKAKRVFIAGDDDQAVFTWAGADVNSFLSFQGKVTILSQSYRVPARVYRLANLIVQRIQHRQPKEWRPREFEGEVFTYTRIEDIPVTSGQWLIMASTNYLLEPIGQWLRSLGLLYERAGVSSLPANTVHAVYDWERLRKGQRISGADVKNVYRYLDTEAVLRGHKTFKAGQDDVTYSIEDLKTNFGLQIDSVWHEALTKISDQRREYIIAMLRRGTKIAAVPNIRISTIHGAKGGEADNVALLMDLGPKFAKEYAQNADNIHRLFYVGVTRAKKTLHLVLPRHSDKGFRL